jgi:hypothetical protein
VYTTVEFNKLVFVTGYSQLTGWIYNIITFLYYQVPFPTFTKAKSDIEGVKATKLQHSHMVGIH